MKVMTPKEQKKFVANTVYGRTIKEEFDGDVMLLPMMPLEIHRHKEKTNEKYCIFSMVAVETIIGCLPMVKHDQINISLN